MFIDPIIGTIPAGCLRLHASATTSSVAPNCWPTCLSISLIWVCLLASTEPAGHFTLNRKFAPPPGLPPSGPAVGCYRGRG